MTEIGRVIALAAQDVDAHILGHARRRVLLQMAKFLADRPELVLAALPQLWERSRDDGAVELGWRVSADEPPAVE